MQRATPTLCTQCKHSWPSRMEEWQRTLDASANGEASLECPSCGEDLLLNLDSPMPRVASFADASLAPTAVTPLEPSAPTVEGRLLALAQTNDRTAIAAKLPISSAVPTAHAASLFQVPQAFA